MMKIDENDEGLMLDSRSKKFTLMNIINVFKVVIPPPITVEPIKSIITYDKAAPRFCHLVRSSRSDQYGFDFKTLKTEGRHIANNVRPGLPADKAGLRDGDFILEVNGESLENMEHDAVVNKISNNPTQVDLLVVGDINAYLAAHKKVNDSFQTRQLPLTHDEVNIDLRLPSKCLETDYFLI